MSNGVPVPLVRANQVFIVAGLLSALALRAPAVVAVVLAVLAAGLLAGPRANLVFIVARPLLKSRLAQAPVEARGLVRFNQLLAVGLLTLSLVAFALAQPLVGWVLAMAVAAAALLALCGFCVGCVIYSHLQVRRLQRGV